MGLMRALLMVVALKSVVVSYITFWHRVVVVRVHHGAYIVVRHVAHHGHDRVLRVCRVSCIMSCVVGGLTCVVGELQVNPSWL